MTMPRYGPSVTRREDDPDRPFCGRCGVEYRLNGGWPDAMNPAIRHASWSPQCPCWQRAYANDVGSLSPRSGEET